MTIVITQVCNRCEKRRELRAVADADDGGWRNVSASSMHQPQRTDKHLCIDCIRAVTEPLPQADG